MAKRKGSADAAVKTDTKKQRQVAKGKSSGRARAKKDPENGEETEEVEIQRKTRAKPRYSKPPQDLPEKTRAKPRHSKPPQDLPEKTSRYFHSPGKEQPSDSDSIPAFLKRSPTKLKSVKKEEEEEKDGGGGDDDDNDEDDDEESEEEDDDWEEVEELEEPLGPVEPVEPAHPSQPVEIDIETPEITRKRLKREKQKAEFENYLRRMMNRFNKDVVEDTHKVHLMCLMANGMFRNRLCSEPDLLAITLSLLPTHFTMVAKQRIDHNFLSGLLKWFGATFTLNPELHCEERPDPQALLERRLGSLTARDHQEMTHLFLLVLRSLQLFCRLVLSLQPLSIKPPSAKGKAKTSGIPPGKSHPEKKPPKESPAKTTSPTETKVSLGTKRPAGGKAERGGKKARKREMGETAVVTGQKPKNSKRRSIASKVSYKEESSEGEEGPSEGEEFQLTSDEESEDSEGGAKSGTAKTGKGNGKSKARSTAPRRNSGGKTKVKSEDWDKDWDGEKDDDEEEEEEGEGEKTQCVKREKKKKKGEKGADEWLEVYVEKTGCWVCVDVEQGVGQPQLCSRQATQPVTYVLALDPHGHLKDLGSKYDPTWLTSTRKRHVTEEWWQETLEPFLAPQSERDQQENKELQAKLMDKPLPTSVAEFKNHPLYALRRHLLKYEALYPPTAATLGYCRGEPVYSRDCVQTLHSKDTWLKEARTVRLGEEPFKMVRGFSNRSRKARMMAELNEKNDLALFGEWQTEEYQPPVAIDGKVPRNDYGNVYLFKPCMLPVGCVHVQLPNLNRVAKKLDMDCALAVTGFDFHGGYSHAVNDGYVICEEHEEILRAAWVEDQEIQRQKETEKREKRAVSNWTLLVKGLLIRERLQRRYGNHGPKAGGVLDQLKTQDGEGEEGLSSGEEGEGVAAPTAAVTLAQSWPQNRQDEQEGTKKPTNKREKRGQQKHLFPFEKV